MARCLVVKKIKDPFGGEAELVCDLPQDHEEELHIDDLNDVEWRSREYEQLPAWRQAPKPVRLLTNAA